MKSKIIVHAILYGLFITAHITASEKPSAIVTTNQTSRPISQYDSPQVSPRRSTSRSSLASSLPIPIPSLRSPRYTTDSNSSSYSSSSPHQAALNSASDSEHEKKSILSSQENIFTIEYFFKDNPLIKTEPPTYSFINPDGTLDKKIILTNDDRCKHKTRYKAQLIIENNRAFVKATHFISSHHGAQEFTKKSQVLIPTTLTLEQIATITQEPQKEKYKVFAIDENNNSYFISYNNNPIEKDSSEEVISSFQNSDESYSIKKEEESIFASTQTKEKPAPFAIIRDRDNTQFLCYVSTDSAHSIDIYKQTEKGIHFDRIITLPIIEESEYTQLLKIDDNQWVCTDKNYCLYIQDHNSNYIPQSNKNSSLLIDTQCIFPETNIIAIAPLTREIQLKAALEKLNEINNALLEKEQKEISPVISGKSTRFIPLSKAALEKLNEINNALLEKEQKKISPVISGKSTGFTRTAIKGLTLMAIFLTILYKLDKLPNVTEFFKRLSDDMPNISFAQ